MIVVAVMLVLILALHVIEVLVFNDLPIRLAAVVIIGADLLMVPLLLLVKRGSRRFVERRWDCGAGCVLTVDQARVSSKRFTVGDSLRHCAHCGSEVFSDRKLSLRRPASGDASQSRLPPKVKVPVVYTSVPRRFLNRRLLLSAGAVVLVLAIVGSGVGWLDYGATYQPLRPAGFTVAGASIVTVTDTVGDKAFSIQGRRGTLGAIEFGVKNDGSTAVLLLGLADKSFPIVGLNWGSDDTSTFGESLPVPVTLRPGASIGLWLVIQKPTCGRRQTVEIHHVGIRWQALGFNHVYVIRLGPDRSGNLLPILVCYPSATLEQVKN